MTSFYDVISDDFQKIHFLRSDFSKNWYDCSFWRYKLTEKNSERFRHFWRRYDVIIFCRWRHFRRFWWRHNDVKNVGIVLNFFLWTCIVKMNNRANFYENRFGRSVFSEKRRIWRHTPKIDDVITPSKMSVSIWIFCGEFLPQNWRSGSIFSHIEWVEPCFPTTRHFVKFSPDCRHQKRRQWRHVSPTN